MLHTLFPLVKRKDLAKAAHQILYPKNDMIACRRPRELPAHPEQVKSDSGSPQRELSGGIAPGIHYQSPLNAQSTA